MPFYTFSCESCGNSFETSCSIQEKERKEVSCPSCGSHELKRVFGSFSVNIKSNSSCQESCPNAGSCPHGGCCPH